MGKGKYYKLFDSFCRRSYEVLGEAGNADTYFSVSQAPLSEAFPVHLYSFKILNGSRDPTDTWSVGIFNLNFSFRDLELLVI